MKARIKNVSQWGPDEQQLRDYYRENRRAYYRDCLKIKDRKTGKNVPFELNVMQDHIERLRDAIEIFHQEMAEDIARDTGEPAEPMPCKIQILKARRGGASTDVEAQMSHFAEFWPGTNGLVVAHRQENANNIAQIARRFFQQFPSDKAGIKIPMQKIGEEIEWGSVEGKPWDSRITIATASAKNFSRGFDYRFLHLSECAHYENTNAIASAKDAAQFAQYIYEESTPNGFDLYFYPSWQKAAYLSTIKAHWKKHRMLPPGWNGKYRFFWAWWQDPDYRLPVTSAQAERILADLTPREEEARAKWGWTAEQIEWRRWKIASDYSEQEELDPEAYFDQEMPSDEVTAFINSGNAVFPQDHLAQFQQKADKARPTFFGYYHGIKHKTPELIASKRSRPDSSDLIIHEDAKPGKQYVLSAKLDPKLENSTMLLFDRTNGSFLREVVSYRGTATAMDLGDLCLWFGYKYNAAFIIPEAYIPSLAQRIAAKGYPYLYQRKNEEKLGNSTASDAFIPGYKTHRNHEQAILHHSQDAFLKEQIEIKTKWLIQQHMSFILKDGAMKPQPGHDSTGVICVALAVFAHRIAAPKVRPVPEYDLTPSTEGQSRQDLAIHRRIREKKKQDRKKALKEQKLREARAQKNLTNLF